MRRSTRSTVVAHVASRGSEHLPRAHPHRSPVKGPASAVTCPAVPDATLSYDAPYVALGSTGASPYGYDVNGATGESWPISVQAPSAPRYGFQRCSLERRLLCCSSGRARFNGSTVGWRPGSPQSPPSIPVGR
jgi:hypothetical protein